MPTEFCSSNPVAMEEAALSIIKTRFLQTMAACQFEYPIKHRVPEKPHDLNRQPNVDHCEFERLTQEDRPSRQPRATCKREHHFGPFETYHIECGQCET
ncbi:hypothetical protein KL942_000170 [Ogataea angusta]|nr:hypothetical protein KL920_000171 [Ogataea angusta]KAG7843074.1 hypothetical protein KL942_000170 [Ogataea angusta]KAG7851292.1 hypothetical protein KL941_000961 [Ogataea angusta]KAG7852774.1 hypothetical protein KL940_000475 [Ogataea angusta]KAG7854667.1 hypothetical protein KL939_004940 [Ogataea angusta]